MTTEQLMRVVTITGELEKLKDECGKALEDSLSDPNALDAKIAEAAMDVAQLKAALAVLKSDSQL
jgi:hypothetical protein